MIAALVIDRPDRNARARVVAAQGAGNYLWRLDPYVRMAVFLICPLWVGSLPTPMAFALADIHDLGDESDHPTYI
jgi:hypothetical protein